MESKPTCIGFIMDGNRRFAKDASLPTFEGHRRGGKVLIDSIHYFRKQNIQHLVYYAFSTENWNRTKEEVAYLMELFSAYLSDLKKEVLNRNAGESAIGIRIIGRREDFSAELQAQMNELEELSVATGDVATTVWIALSYGGRAELIEAINVAIGQGRAVTEESFSPLLWTGEMPDADIIVRTGGEQRLSNFLTWRSVYSELYFIDKYWPALTATDFKDILDEYAKRERRHGR